MKYSFTSETPLEETIDSALRRVKTRRELADALGNESRMLREYAAQVFVGVAGSDATLLQDFEDDIVDALDRPESLTRYSMLEVIAALSQLDSKIVLKAYEPLEDCLYDEDSGTVRLYAFRVFAAYGASGPARSQKVWSDLSMALRCYRGDQEFIPMMNELITMLGGKVDQKVKDSAAELFFFDIENAKGLLKRKAELVATFAPEVIEQLRAEAQRKSDEAEARKAAEAEAAEAANDDEEDEEEAG